MRKGAIGPIADDIPSIFPIIASVIMFIAAVAYASSILSQRDSYLSQRKAALGLSSLVTAQGFTDDNTFNSNCISSFQSFAERNNVKFFISIKRFCKYVDFSNDPFSGKVDYGGGVKYADLQCPLPLPSPLPPKDYQSLVFPIAVNCTAGANDRGVGIANVIVWR